MLIRLPLLPHPVRWLPVGIVAGLICYWSLVTTPPSLEVASTPTELTTSGYAGLAVPDSYAHHATAYAILTLTPAYGLADHQASSAARALLVFTVATGYGGVIEVAQLFQPDRVGSLVDVFVNAVGAATALSWYGLER